METKLFYLHSNNEICDVIDTHALVQSDLSNGFRLEELKILVPGPALHSHTVHLKRNTLHLNIHGLVIICLPLDD